MTDEESAPSTKPDSEQTQRPEPAPGGPFAPPPNRPAIPEYDEKGIKPDGWDTR